MDLKTLLSQYQERTRFYASEVARALTRRQHALLVTTLRSLAVQPAPCSPRGLLPHVQSAQGPATTRKALEARLRALAQYGLIRCIARQGRQPVYALSDWGRLVLQWLPPAGRIDHERTVNNHERTDTAGPTDRRIDHKRTVPARPPDRRIDHDMTVPAVPTDRRIDHERTVNNHEMIGTAVPPDRRIDHEMPGTTGRRTYTPRRQYDWATIDPQLAALEAQGLTLAASARRLGIPPVTAKQHRYKQRKRQGG